jgi:hypothetical protein
MGFLKYSDLNSIFVKLLIFLTICISLSHSSAQISFAASINLVWNANGESDLKGYKIYYRTSSGSYGDPLDVGKVTSFELSGLVEGVTYYIALTAYDTSFNESDKCEEASGVATEPTNTSTSTTTTIITLGTELLNGTYDTGSVIPTEEDLYYIDVPVGQGYLLVELSGNPDADLYVRYGSPPSLALWDCSPYSEGSNETCSFSNPDSGIWYIMVQGYTGTVDYDIIATYNTGTPPITTTTTTSPPPPGTTTTIPSTTTTTSPGTTTIPSETSTTTIPSGTTTTASPVTTTIPSGTSTTTIPSDTTTTAVTTTTTSETTTIPATTTVSLVDDTPPTGTVLINNGFAVSQSLNVLLTLYAADGGHELNKSAFMSFSNDNQLWSDPEPYRTEKLWTLSPGEGMKTVYVQFRDATGNWMSVPAQDQIVYEASLNACDISEKLRPIATTASSQFLPLFSKENAVDGNPSTTWSTLFSFFKKDEFITLDLGAIKRITWFTMQAASSLFGTDFFPVNFKLEISKDNLTWEEISTEQGYVPPLQSTRSDTWDFKNLECRYIRVYISKAKTLFFFFKVAQIAEIEVYGCDIPGQLPTLDHEQPTINGEREGVRTPERADKEKDKDSEGQPSIPGRPVVTFPE